MPHFIADYIGNKQERETWSSGRTPVPGRDRSNARPGRDFRPPKYTFSNLNVKSISVFHLAIESSTRVVSVCILEGSSPISSRTVDGAQTTSSGLVPEIEAALQDARIQPREIGLVSVSIGPGSFTGLRIGVMFAKTMAFALKSTALVGVNTHEVIAQQGLTSIGETDTSFSSKIATVINAQRGQWFVALFDSQSDPFQPIGPNRILGMEQFMKLDIGPCWMCGPGLAVGDVDSLTSTGKFRVCPVKSWQPCAAVVGQIGWTRFQRGETTDSWRLNPVYGRMSAAEEKLRDSVNE